MIKRWILPFGLIKLSQFCLARLQFYRKVGQSIAQKVVDSGTEHFSKRYTVNFNVDAIGSHKFLIDLYGMNQIVLIIKNGRPIHSGFAYIQL